MSKKLPIYIVDAFTSKLFSGNPAGVCLLDQQVEDSWLQSVAAEMNLSETAFVLPLDDGFSLRWFTATAEVDLCGHATLASAHLLWELSRLGPAEMARFMTRSGLLTATKQGELIELNFPEEAVTPAEAVPELALGLLNYPMRFVGWNRMDYLVELESEEIVREIKPDFALLGKVPARGIIITSKAKDARYDFVSRFFAPRLGVPEDPVCGSAHCALAPYWGSKLGKTRMVGHQVSLRGGVVTVEIANDRILLSGQAITVINGEIVSNIRD